MVKNRSWSWIRINTSPQVLTLQSWKIYPICAESLKILCARQVGQKRDFTKVNKRGHCNAVDHFVRTPNGCFRSNEPESLARGPESGQKHDINPRFFILSRLMALRNKIFRQNSFLNCIFSNWTLLQKKKLKGRRKMYLNFWDCFWRNFRAINPFSTCLKIQKNGQKSVFCYRSLCTFEGERKLLRVAI